jgi:hypothetical protein
MGGPNLKTYGLEKVEEVIEYKETKLVFDQRSV